MHITIDTPAGILENVEVEALYDTYPADPEPGLACDTVDIYVVRLGGLWLTREQLVDWIGADLVAEQEALLIEQAIAERVADREAA